MIVEVKLIHAACLPPWAFVFAPDLIFALFTLLHRQRWPNNIGFHLEIRAYVSSGAVCILPIFFL